MTANNIGTNNKGTQNDGCQNKGYQNKGDQNNGDQNWGDQNWGDQNNGDQNNGYHNNGYRNNGSYNKGDQLYGYFNTGKPEFRFFNKPFDEGKLDEVKFPKWLNYEVKPVNMTWIERYKMTDEQKKIYSSSEITGGFLLVETIDDWEKSNKEAALKAWNETTEEDRQLTLQLPNFDADIFFDIFGIDVKQKTESKNTAIEEIIVLNGKKYKLIEG